jgi:dTDP-4-amino-4,6-dideoxygalactose transaminase
LEKISTVVKTGDFTLGSEVSKFEDAFASQLGARFGIGVNSGTDALFLSLKAVGVKPGDEVITAANTFIATAGAINAAGAKPVYCDVTDEFVINPELIEYLITPKTRAIVPVHYAGVPADMEQIVNIAEKHNISVVEDACQAFLAELNGQCTGTFGATGAFSLHPLKNLNVWGDAGIIVTDDEQLAATLRLLRNHGLRNRDEVDFFGYNSRLDSIQAVVGSHLIATSNWITETRIKWATMMDRAFSELEGAIQVPERREGKRYVHHLYMVMAQNRDQLMAFLIEKGVDVKIHYPIPLHLQRCSAHLGYQVGDFPVTEQQAHAIITFPVHQHLQKEHVDYMIKCVRKFYEQ